jgi:hypothetical protein
MTRKLLSLATVGAALFLGSVVAASPAQASTSGCGAVEIWATNGAQAWCDVVIAPGKFRAVAVCQSDATGSLTTKYGAWKTTNGQTTTYCNAGYSIHEAKVERQG